MQLKVVSFTDESGQDTKGKMFVVCTIICASEDANDLDKALSKIESSSGKEKKWHDTGDKRRHRYIKEIINSNIRTKFKVYYTMYQNKSEYSKLVGAHIAKAVINHTKEVDYKVTIFIDKMNKETINEVAKEIKSFRIRYRKIRGLSEKASSLIRLADAACGLIRDLPHSNVANSYKRFFRDFKEI